MKLLTYAQAQTELGALSFAMDDVRLFLDTHPCEQAALSMYASLGKNRGELAHVLAQKGRPVNFYDAGGAGHWNWTEGPWPWEKED